MKQISSLNQNIITEDGNDNVVEIPAHTVFSKLYQEKLSVCFIEINQDDVKVKIEKQ